MHAITIQSLQLSYLLQASAHSAHFILHTVFLQSDAAATICFTAHFVWLLFEGGIYFFGKPGDINDGWIGYERVRWLTVAKYVQPLSPAFRHGNDPYNESPSASVVTTSFAHMCTWHV